jgi:hypothetical protein
VRRLVIANLKAEGHPFMIDSFDSLVAKLAEAHRRDCQQMATTMLANLDIVPFRQATLFLLTRMATGATIPTLVETRRLSGASARFQSALNRAGKARKSAGLAAGSLSWQNCPLGSPLAAKSEAPGDDPILGSTVQAGEAKRKTCWRAQV